MRKFGHTPEQNEPTPEFLQSELVKQDEDLTTMSPRWPGAHPVAHTTKVIPYTSKALSEPSLVARKPGLTVEAKEKWRAPSPSVTRGPLSEYSETKTFPESKGQGPIKILISKLKDAGSVGQLKSVGTLICE